MLIIGAIGEPFDASERFEREGFAVLLVVISEPFGEPPVRKARAGEPPAWTAPVGGESIEPLVRKACDGEPPVRKARAGEPFGEPAIPEACSGGTSGEPPVRKARARVFVDSIFSIGCCLSNTYQKIDTLEENYVKNF